MRKLNFRKVLSTVLKCSIAVAMAFTSLQLNLQSTQDYKVSAAISDLTSNELRASINPIVQSYEKASTTGVYKMSSATRFVILADQNSMNNDRLQEVVKLINSECMGKEVVSNAPLAMVFGSEADATADDILITIDPVKAATTGSNSEEAYMIEIGADGVKVYGASENAVMYALRSIYLYMISIDGLAYGTIKDYPQLEERRLHVDCGRKYISKDWFIRQIREMSYMKFNTLQMHFSENAGFRIECETDPLIVSDQYLTKAEVREILAEAKKYGIKVIPSFDSPGHVDQILRAHPEYGQVDIYGNHYSSGLDVTNPEAVAYIYSLYDEYMELFKGCTDFHIGGDEYMEFDRAPFTTNYKSVLDNYARESLGAGYIWKDVLANYINELAAYVYSKGFKPRVWNDGLYYGESAYEGAQKIEMHKYIGIDFWSQMSWNYSIARLNTFVEKGHTDIYNVNASYFYYVLRSSKPTDGREQHSFDVLNQEQNIYNNWTPGKFQENTVADSSSFIKGSCVAIWCDIPSVCDEDTINADIAAAMRSLASKSWNVNSNGVANYTQFAAMTAKLGDPAGFAKGSTLPVSGDILASDSIGSYRVKFVDKDGVTLHDDVVKYGNLEDAYTIEALDLYGYRLVEGSESTINGTYTNEEAVYTFTYELYTDKTQLNALIDAELNEVDYIPETFAEYKEAMVAAKLVQANASAHQRDVDAVVAEVEAALAKVVLVKNYALYVEANYPLAADGYAAGYEAYQEAVEQAKSVLAGNGDATAVKAAYDAINAAKADLVKASSSDGISITATKDAYSTYRYTNMIDGNLNTKTWFNGAQVAGEEIVFTFDHVVNMSSVTIAQPSDVGGDALEDADILVAGADGTFKTVGNIKANEITKTISFDAQAVKQVKILLKASKDNWYQISEVSFAYEEFSDDGMLEDMILEAESFKIEGKDIVLVNNMISALIDAQKAYVAGGAGEEEQLTLRAAIDALLDGEVNKAPLAAMISQADAKVEEQYTSTSWAAMKEVYDRAVALYENEETVQSDVSAMVLELNAAIKALEKRADKSALNELIASAEALDISRATAESQAVFNQALAAAKVVAANLDVTEAEINEAKETLKAAMDNLDFGQLKAENLINKSANDGVTVVSSTSGYIGETADKTLDYRNTTHWHSDWSDSSQTLPQAIVYDLGKEYALSDITFLPRQDNSYNGDITEMKVYVGNSVDALEYVDTFTFEKGYSGLTNRTEFKRMIVQATGRYVKVEATKSAADSQQDKFASMAEIRFYGTEPSEEPEVPSVDKTALSEVIDAARLVIESAVEYTEETMYAFDQAYNTALDVEANENATQAEVDAAKVALVAAMEALEEKQPEVPYPTIPAKVENVVAKDTNYKTITLTWDASEGATAYEVYRKAYDSEEFKLYKTVEDTTLAVSGVMTGKEYAFYVVAKNEAGAAEASATVTKATTLHGKVTLAIEKVSTATFKLSWNKIDGATRYIVYRKRNDDKMKKVLTLGSKDLEYLTAEMPNGDYQFVLKAGRYDSKDRVMTKASNTVKGRVEELAPAVTLKAGTKSINVSWKKVEGVTHYQVYRATSENGKYTKLITTKELSYTAKSLSSGKKYFFKVRGYKTYKSGENIKYTVYTPYSTIKYAKAK